MKKKDLVNKLKNLGFWEEGGAKHEKWTNGDHIDFVPRHNEINEFTAKNILKRCQVAAKKKDR